MSSLRFDVLGTNTTNTSGSECWVRPEYAVVHLVEPKKLFLLFLVLGVLIYTLYRSSKYDDDFPIVNRKFALEPSLFSRLRWTVKSQKLLDDAYEKYDGQVYRIARGDTDVVVVPAECITELNRLPQNVCNSRICHAYSMTGHLNGMDVVLKTNLHVRTLLNRITPALPEIVKPARIRIAETMNKVFSQDTRNWKVVKPVEEVVYCVSRVITLASVGAPVCDDPEFILFTVMFLMRMVPSILQPFVVWLLPARWRLRQSSKELESFVIPEAIRRKSEKQEPPKQDLLSWMMHEAKNERERDPYMLTNLLAALAAGGTYSSANFIVGVVFDLVGHPHFLEEIRREIRDKHQESNGNWDFATFNSLHKLDSAMKETARLAPGSNTTYSRVMCKDYTLYNGVTLKKGQFICVNSFRRSMDPSVFPDPEKYDALRAYNENLKSHIAQPFRSFYGEDFRWGAGRWACPGRFLASLLAKVVLVKLLDEYDFAFVGSDKRPPKSVVHEFLYIDPGVELKIRRRETNSGIEY
ncbi:cytochrome P450 [Lindgomyces ingoldianus]|uniref:Cytochrome P450 n=1 Tax=Lindgomyces ingoldianus TaxID=673940 RepID=A0ACB6RGK4_9PLEO|nr:cytochrome P450 [Lindgomyces ingoldianus]KAF2478185.1 cytochrome P450 [Lindgomyces ingoldianus]